jgi:hypothetical protein
VVRVPGPAGAGIKVVGSVGRSHTLRSDFRTGQAVTARFRRGGEAMQLGKALPSLELYKLKGKEEDGRQAESRYYVVDGHHRVAMAKQIGIDALDAHVIEYRVEGKVPDRPAAGESKKKEAGG